MKVIVKNKDNSPLNPIRPAQARILLKENKVKVQKTNPFTIKYLKQQESSKDSHIVGIKWNQNNISVAVISNKETVYQIFVDQVNTKKIKFKMEKRANYRRSKRNRKLRYRKPRFNNRIKKNTINPTMRSYIQNIVREIEFCLKSFPNIELRIETLAFPKEKIGVSNDWDLIRKAVYKNYNYKCKICNKKGKLHAHHIVFRSNGGTDEMSNLVCLCEDCHKKVHQGKLNLKGKRIKKKYDIKESTQRLHIISELRKRYDFVEVFGYEVSKLRLKQDFNMVLDAVLIANGITTNNNVLFKRNVTNRKSYMTLQKHSQGKIVILPRGKIEGFRNHDLVKWRGVKCFVNGVFNKGRNVKLVDAFGNIVKGLLKPIIPKPNFCTRINRMRSQLIWNSFMTEVFS